MYLLAWENETHAQIGKGDKKGINKESKMFFWELTEKTMGFWCSILWIALYQNFN